MQRGRDRAKLQIGRKETSTSPRRLAQPPMLLCRLITRAAQEMNLHLDDVHMQITMG